MSKRLTIMFYCQRERDRIVAERLSTQLRHHACVLGGPVYGYEYFDLSPEHSHLAKVQQLPTAESSPPEGRRLGLKQPYCNSWRDIISASRAKVRREIFRRILAYLWRAHPPGSAHPLPREFRDYRDWRAGAARLLDAVRPDVLILFDVETGQQAQAMAVIATERCIPYVIIPQTIPNPLEQATYYAGTPAYNVSGLFDRLTIAIWPRWVYKYRGRRRLYLPIGAIWAQHLYELAPKTPWILNSGAASAVCVECEALRRQYAALGFPSGQTVVCGHPVDDVLHVVGQERAMRRQDLEKRLGLAPGRPLVVVGFPPDQYTSPSVAQFEWPDFLSMCRGWREALESCRPWANVIIRPHPRLPIGNLKILSDADFPVCAEPTEELVPLADLYVASVSATIRWALACGVPVVNYDCYRYGYEDYKAALSVYTVESCASLRQVLGNLAGDPRTYMDAKERAEADSGNWGTIDGHFVERFETVLARIVSDRDS